MALKRNREAGEPLLDKPRILSAEPGALSQWLFYGALLLLGTLGALGCFFGAFQVPVAPVPAALCGIACLLACLFLFLVKNQPWAVSLALIGLWVGVVALFFQDLVQGCAHTVNGVLQAYSEKFGIALPSLAVDTLSPSVVERQCTVFFCLLTFPFLFFLGWFLVGKRSCLGAFLLSGLMLLFPMIISLVPPGLYLGALLLFWLALLLTAPTLGRRHRLLEEGGRFHAAGTTAARPAMLLTVLGAGILCMGLASLLFPQGAYQRPQIAADLRDGLTQGFGIQAALRGGVGSGNGRVNLDALGTRSYTGETVLRVQYDWGDSQREDFVNGEKDYLKSFVGSVYTGRSWERLSREDEAQLDQLLDGVHPQTLADLFQEDFGNYSTTRASIPYTLSVENVGASPRCLYLPYGLTAESVDPESMEYVEDGFLQSPRFFSGTRSYEVEAWGGTDFVMTYSGRASSAVANAYAGSLLATGQFSSWEQVVASTGMREFMETLSQEMPGSQGESLSLEEVERWTIPSSLIGYLSPEQQALARSLEAYNRFVYEHYTQLPDSLRQTLEQYLLDNHLVLTVGNGFSVSDSSPLMLAQQIASTLAAQCVYTLSPPSLPEGQDFVEYFLFQSRQGYCVHFATAAVALFRAAGVPARYAEGYAVPSGEEGWVDVPDYNAHAWVEIYMGGTGWIPVEVTPAGPDAPAASEDARPVAEPAAPTPEAASPTPTPTPLPSPSASPAASPSASPSAEPSPSASPSSAPGGAPAAGGRTSGRAWGAAAGAAGGLLLLLGALLFRRRLILARRNRRFAQPDRNQAALALYAHILELQQAALAHLPAWRRELPQELESLALKARFSQHTLTQEELQPFQREALLLEDALRRNLPPLWRLWLQWGPALL